jgi:integral membrane sensor domain MASE1
MSFVKGFVTTILLYFGLTLLFTVLDLVMLGTPVALAFSAIFSGVDSIGALLYSNLALPTVDVSFYAIASLFLSYNTWLLVYLLGIILPPALAAIIGAVVAKKSGTVKSVFAGTFGGLLLVSVVGVIIQVLYWPTGIGVNLGFSYYLNWEWFLPSALIMTAFNAFFWSAVGLLLTSKTWD